MINIDDILVFSSTAAEHKLHLQAVLFELREHKMLIKASICFWGQTELPYLGHIISKDGLKPDPKKVQSVVDWPQPTCLREVLQILGLTNFFIKYSGLCKFDKASDRLEQEACFVSINQ